MDRQTVVERKVRLDGTTEEFICEVLLLEPGRRAVLRYVIDRDWSVAGVLTVPRGAVTVSHYWCDRPYNVYHWINEGRTLAFYVNIVGATEISDALVSYDDLVVDVLLRPSGAIEILDEEELPPDLEPASRKAVADALEAVVTSGRGLAADVERESRRLLPPSAPR